jgi:hypothetical protein
MDYSRELSKKFMNDLKPNGLLYPILTRVQEDHTLMLAIRRNYINIYYRGGNILRLREHSEGFYQTHFDVNYARSGQTIPDLPVTVTNLDDAKCWIGSFGNLKNIMDEYFSKYGRSEREFQQLLARENNFSSISGETEYFVSDIEVAFPFARFDIMAIRWPVKDRKVGNLCRAALIEMKYGDNAIGGKAGLLKHLKDMHTLTSNKNYYSTLLQTMESQFNQLDELELLKFNKGTSEAKVTLDVGKKPELILILANHNPRSSRLFTILSDPEISEYGQSNLFDLRFNVSSFAGYGLHTGNMHTLDQFRDLCKV